MKISVVFCLAAGLTPSPSFGQDLMERLPKPMLNAGSWVLIEVWPEVMDITLSAYFLDSSYQKNKNLCDAAKRVFDREQEVRGTEENKKLTSYRLCMSVNDALAKRYIKTE